MQIRTTWLYKKFSSIKTSILFLGILSFFYLLGTIFPQGGDINEYINAGGRFIFLVKIFGLLDAFTTPWFLITSLLLLISLSICSYERLLTLMGKQILDTAPTKSYIIPLNTGENIDNTFIKKLNFKKSYSNPSATVVTRGISYKWLTLIYHLGILLCFTGFFLTYMSAFEDEVIIYPDETKAIQPSSQSRLQRLLGKKHKELPFKIKLEEFITEYNQMPSIDYPKDKLSRLAVGLGWTSNSLNYKIKDDSLFPKDWKSRLRVIKDDALILEKTIEVNEPLKYGGFTFYQAAFKQDIKIEMDGGPLAIDAEVGKETIIPGLEGEIVFKNLRTGTLFKRDGTTEKIIPFVDVYIFKKISDGKTDKEKIGRLEKGSLLTIGSKTFGIKGFSEATILSYRYDPGVPILWFGGIMTLIAMALRIYSPWYRVIYRVDVKDGRTLLKLSINTKGLLADKEHLIKRIQHFVLLSKNP
ncbi:MAG: hypothetical protein A2073_05935 [Deltaproteobacteria bacterium GWC2_42_11]|nr:MAG: hypothetical protein A2073_05935 [Deltaproteobacteria bacterium GWC2_42_11]